MQFIRLFQHLLPRARAWQLTVDSTLRRYFEGLSGLPEDVRTFVDLIYLDLLPRSTRELSAWEKQWGLSSGGSEAARRNKLALAWATHGRMSPDYIQRALQGAGFNVFVHEWWASGPPYVPRDPRNHTTQPLSGIYQCEASNPWECFDAAPGQTLAPHCDDTLANDPGYLVNLDLTRRAPPPIPDDPSKWPYFIYVGGESFPDREPVPASRLAELKEILLRICPTEQWIVLLVDASDETGGFGSTPFGGGPIGS